MREAVELVQNEGSDLEDFSDSDSEENTVDSGEEFVPVDLEVDSNDSDNSIFIIGIRATSRIKLLLFSLSFLLWIVLHFLLCCCNRERYLIRLYRSFSTRPKLSKNVCVYLIIPGSLFTKKFFTWEKTVLTGAESVILWSLEWVNTHDTLLTEHQTGPNPLLTVA